MKCKRSEHNWKLIGINSSSSECWIITAQVLDFTLLGVTSCARINKPWPSSVFRKDFILRLVAGGICILQNSSDWHSFFLQTFFPLFFFSSAKLKPKPSQVLQVAPPSATDASSGSTACLLPTVAHSQLQMCPSKMIHSHTVLYPKPQSVVLFCGRQLIFYF